MKIDGPPVMLTGRWIDIPLLRVELESVANLAPPERRAATGGQKRTSKRGKKSINDRAAAYLSKMDAAISGEEGHKVAFAAACALILGFDLSVEEARPLFAEYNERFGFG